MLGALLGAAVVGACVVMYVNDGSEATVADETSLTVALASKLLAGAFDAIAAERVLVVTADVSSETKCAVS